MRKYSLSIFFIILFSISAFGVDKRGIRKTIFDGFNISNGEFKIYGIKLVNDDVLHPLVQDFYVEDIFLLSEIENNWQIEPMAQKPKNEHYQYFLYLEKEDSIYVRVGVNIIEGYVEIIEKCYYFNSNLFSELLPFARYLKKEKYKYDNIDEGRENWTNLMQTPSLFKIDDFTPDWANYKGEFVISYIEYNKDRAPSDIKAEIINGLDKKFSEEKIRVELTYEKFAPNPHSPHEYWFKIKIENPKVYEKQKLYTVIVPLKKYKQYYLTTFWKEDNSVSSLH